LFGEGRFDRLMGFPERGAMHCRRINRKCISRTLALHKELQSRALQAPKHY